MPSERSSWYALDLGVKNDEADLANGDVVVTGAIVTQTGTVKEVWVGTQTKPTAGTLAVARAASTPVVLLSGTYDLTGLTNHVGAKMTLATTVKPLRVTAGQILTATWTLTTITNSQDAALCCTVLIEPDEW